MIAPALVAIAVAMLLVRTGWGGRRRVSAGGWALGVVALVALACADGAWGIALGGIVGIAAALAIVLHAGWTARAKVRRPAREAPSVTMPHQPAEILRRLAVFVLVVPVAFVAAQWLAFGLQALTRRGGVGETDASVLTLFLQPVLWSVLMAWQMTRASTSRMIAPPVATAALGTILWGLS